MNKKTAPFDKQAYNKAYNANTYKLVSFRFNKDTDRELLEWLESQDNTTGYIRDLIRKDIQHARRTKKWMQRSGKYEHDNIRQYPYEVIEALPNHDYYTIGYTRDLEDAALLIMNYCDQGTPVGQISIIQRHYDNDLRCVAGVNHGN